MSRELMQQALEALEKVTKHFTRTPSTLMDSEARGEAHKAITALRERLAQPEQQKPPLTDEQIEELLPEADGTAEEVKRKVEYRPGLWADEVGIDDAWSKPLVIEIIRAVEKHHGIGGKA